MRNPTIKKIRRSDAQWRTLFVKQAQSRESSQRFCQRRGTGYSTFAQWKVCLLNKESYANPVNDFVELAVPMTRPDRHWDVELTVGEGVVLRVARR